MTDPARELLDAIARRDFAQLASCFADDATLRALTPHQTREDAGSESIADRYRSWLSPLEEFQLVEGDAEPVADHTRIRYRFRGRNPAKGWQENEHTGYARILGSEIAELRLTCSGFRPLERR